MKILYSRHNRFLVLTGVSMILITLILSAIVFAQDDVSPPYMNPSRILSAVQKEMTIVKKMPGSVLAGETRYVVTPDTVIEMGKDSLTFKEMPVPCKVLGYYEKNENQDPELVKIDIQEIASRVTKDWSSPSPE